MFRVGTCLFLAVFTLLAGVVEDEIVMGRKALANDGVATAWRLAQDVLHSAPESAAAHEFAGEVRFRRGEFAEADAEFKTAISWDARNALAWWGLGRVAECTSMNKTALDDFRRAYELDPNEPRILMAWLPRLQGQERVNAMDRYLAMMKAAGASGAAEQNAINELRQRAELAKALAGRPAMALTSPYKPTEVPLQSFTNGGTHERRYGLELRLNDMPAQLVLDTGAAGIVLSRTAAERLGLVRVGTATVHGIGDNNKSTSGFRAVAQTLQIGDVTFNNVPISVSNQIFANLEDGLIGANVLGEFLITLDFPAKKIRLAPLDGYHPGDEFPDRIVTPQMENATRVFRFGHLLLVPVRVGKANNSLFVLDTGASNTMISYQLAEAVSNLSRDEKTGLTGLNGRVADVYKTGSLALDFAGFEQRSMGITAFDTWQLSHQLGTEISGFLGLPTLDLLTVTIDYRDGLVKFERKP